MCDIHNWAIITKGSIIYRPHSIVQGIILQRDGPGISQHFLVLPMVTIIQFGKTSQARGSVMGVYVVAF